MLDQTGKFGGHVDTFKSLSDSFGYYRAVSAVWQGAVCEYKATNGSIQ